MENSKSHINVEDNSFQEKNLSSDISNKTIPKTNLNLKDQNSEFHEDVTPMYIQSEISDNSIKKINEIEKSSSPNRDRAYVKTNTGITTYERDRCPPNFEQSRKHQRATKPGIPKKDYSIENVCPCCYLPYDIEPLPLCGSLKKIDKALGLGFRHYFLYIKAVSWMLFTAYAIVGAYTTVRYLNGFKCRDNVTCETKFYGQFMPVNVEWHLVDDYQKYLSLVTFCILYIFEIYLIWYSKNSRLRHFVREQSPAHYTAYVDGIPLGETAESIKSFFETRMKKTDIIANVNLVYKIDELYH